MTRSARECEIRWLGDRHPKFNHAPWTSEELDKVRELISDKAGQVDWVQVSNELGVSHNSLLLRESNGILKGHRTPLDCMRNAIKRQAIKWTPETDDALLKAVDTYGVNNWTLGTRLLLSMRRRSLTTSFSRYARFRRRATSTV